MTRALIERNPLRFWRGLALVLALVLADVVRRLPGVLRPLT